MAKHNGHVVTLARLFRILGDETRLRVLMLLADHGELNVSSLCRKLKSPQPTVSHHLGILRMGEIVSNRRAGKEIYYSLADLKRHKYARSIRTVLKDSAAVQVGPILLGMTDDET
jgi:ArsR family transcriptional regulator